MRDTVKSEEYFRESQKNILGKDSIKTLKS